MFVVFGSPRSGTTLLAESLDLNDQIVVPDETDFIVPLAFVMDRVAEPMVGRELLKRLVTQTVRYPKSIGHYLAIDDVHAAIDRAPYRTWPIVEAIYDAMAEKHGRLIAGDKSPNDIHFVRMLLKQGLAESPVKVIHLVRDVRGVLASLTSVTWSPTDVQMWFPRLWSFCNLYLHEALAEQTHRYMLIRYEDLVQEPREALDRMCRFLGVPFQEQMLDHTRRGQRHAHEPSHANVLKPVLPQRADSWRSSLSEELQRRCLTQAAEGLERFGYL